jgi:hypothetical protein
VERSWLVRAGFLFAIGSGGRGPLFTFLLTGDPYCFEVDTIQLSNRSFDVKSSIFTL